MAETTLEDFLAGGPPPLAPGHKAGFVNIIGKPNAGKSTLMNALVGEKLAIATPKAQTTRHRIMGIVNEPDYQIVYSDTPGLLRPKYGLHKAMMQEVEAALKDADVLVFLADVRDPEPVEAEVLEQIRRVKAPRLFVVNKVDMADAAAVELFVRTHEEALAPDITFRISALNGTGLQELQARIVGLLPESPPFFGKDEVTDRTERFLASEIVREQIFRMYRQEIPYSTEVIVTSFKDEQTILRIEADIIVERGTQKGILIGHKGEMLKQVGTAARLELEKFFEKKIYLGLHVRVKENWRDDPNYLRQIGYNRK